MTLTDEDLAIRKAPRYMRDTIDGRAALSAIYATGRLRGLEEAAKACEEWSDRQLADTMDADQFPIVIRALAASGTGAKG